MKHLLAGLVRFEPRRRGGLKAMQNAAQFPYPVFFPGPTLIEKEPSVAFTVAGVSASWRKLLLQAEMAGPHVQVASIEGKHGVGKQTLAQYLLCRSPLAGLPFSGATHGNGSWAKQMPQRSPGSPISIVLTCWPLPGKGFFWGFSSRCRIGPAE